MAQGSFEADVKHNGYGTDAAGVSLEEQEGVTQPPDGPGDYPSVLPDLARNGR